MLRSTMQDEPLSVVSILRHGATVHSDSVVETADEVATRAVTYAKVALNAARLAGALRSLGIGYGDRVGSLLWNTQEHLEAYLAVPAMGAVLHTLNPRLPVEQLEYVINHAEDKVIVADLSLMPLLEGLVARLPTVRHIIVVGGLDAPGLETPTYDYGELLGAELGEEFDWPRVDENFPAAMCYTSGTTGNPKGVVYSHRSIWLHSMSLATGNVLGLTDHDRLLPIVPMFHANAWGLPYAGWFAGTDFVMPGRFTQAEPLARLISTSRPTVSSAVPTIWNELLHHIDEHPTDLSSLRMVLSGGSAVSRSLMEEFQDRHNVRIVQAWGMTETSPLAAVAHPPKAAAGSDDWQWRASTGRVCAGVELRLVDSEGHALPWDGRTVGEMEVRGPWVTGGYYGEKNSDKVRDGWLRTGDVATVTSNGFIQITDRTKDVIKSGGEWISSVELENHLMAHPAVFEAAVVAVPDDRWGERPLACVVLADGQRAAFEDLKTFLTERVASWQLPERWAWLEVVPKTGVGKFDKKALRQQYGNKQLHVEFVGGSAR